MVCHLHLNNVIVYLSCVLYLSNDRWTTGHGTLLFDRVITLKAISYK